MVPDSLTKISTSLKLVNDHQQLLVMADWLARFAEDCGLSDQMAFHLDLVLTEAVTNVMDHARPVDGRGEIELTCALHDGAISVRVTDDGPAFDPVARTQLRLPKTLAEAEPGGLGIHLMRQYTSCLNYRRENDLNILTMTLPLQ